MLRQIAEREGLELTVQSAGVSAYDGGPISVNSFTILKEKKGFDGTITSSALAEAAVREADLILTMTQTHKRSVIQMFPDAADKTFTLKEYVEDDPRVFSRFEELGRLYAELQMQQALGQPVAEQLRRRISELESLSPNYDISDLSGDLCICIRQRQRRSRNPFTSSFGN